MPPLRLQDFALTLLLAIPSACTTPANSPAQLANRPHPSSQIAFVRDSHLYLIRSDGAGEREIASNVADDLPIEWSPNRRFIVYPGLSQTGVSNLWAIDTEHPAAPINLTHLPTGVARSPAFSPDSKHLAFMCDKPPGLHVLTIGAKEPPRRLTHDGQMDQIPAWSFDGKSLVYGELVFTDESAVEKFRMQLFIAHYDPAATGVAPATPIPAGDGASDSPALLPVVSASPYTLAFRAHRRGNDEIALLDPIHLAAPEINLTRSSTHEHDPRWSPDGRQLAFWRRTASAHELWTIEPDGSHPTRLCMLPAEPAPGPPEWSPDSRQIAFAFSHARAGIWIMNATGGNPRRIATGTQIKWR